MKSPQILKQQLYSEEGLKKLAWLYCCDESGALLQAERYAALLDVLQASYGPCAEAALFSAPGRTEIGGNHTDHEHGRVLAGSVNIDIIAAVKPNDQGLIRITSEGFAPEVVDLHELQPVEAEKNTSTALIRGMAARFAQMGCQLNGFDACMTSNVPKGSGVSSSAAYEVMVGVILNTLFNDGQATPVQIAQIGQYAENVYFGKPCGLMDQTASAVGNIITIDFADNDHPDVQQVAFDFARADFALCILDSGADHADLTHEYAAVTEEMRAVCAQFGKTVLREVPEEEFWAALPRVRAACGDRAALRAIHTYNDNRRVAEQVQALRANHFDRFLQLVNESGRSSFMYLQNVIPAGAVREQAVAVALAVAQQALGGRGACRVHGGGFAGTIQAFVPMDMLDNFKQKTEAVLGEGKCHVLSIRPVGGVQVL